MIFAKLTKNPNQKYMFSEGGGYWVSVLCEGWGDGGGGGFGEGKISKCF